ncbi:MAG TPA: RNB domain-containing ribonuclease [Rhodanobacteraceae bacterium]|nr:RNB domain-containing ribonuclease [Rhodanobacteraceae bacterium]
MSTTRRLRVQAPARAVLARGMDEIVKELKLPQGFPAEVEAAAAAAAKNPRLPDEDRTDIPLVTIDPPESMDLDQAMHVERRDGGYRVYYAIADVAAFVRPGDAIDIEARRRGETLYGADSAIPLHPTVLCNGATSLLPDQLRPALLWTIDLDTGGEGIAVDVHRARVRSRAKLNYAGVQAEIDAGTADPMWAVLREIGELRAAREKRRGGVSLPLPEQEIRVDDDGRWHLEHRGRLAVENWNEQISLLTGMAAAHIMVKGRIGLLRTLPPPPHWAIERLRRSARGLHIDWPAGLDYAGFIATLDPARPHHIAMLIACTTVLRGAGYAAFDGELPEQPLQSALAAEYAHATAPLRRLVDRFVGETCVALCAGEPVPDWVREALPTLPDIMQSAGQRASRYEHAVLNLAEAALLSARVGEHFAGVVVDLDRHDPQRGDVMIADPAIQAKVDGPRPLPLGEDVQVTLAEADPATRTTRFSYGTAETAEQPEKTTAGD